jgi:hypothetical protein
MLTVLLFVAVLFKVFHVENLCLCTYLALALVIRLTIAIRIESLEASLNSSVYKAYNKATRQIEAPIRHCSFRTGKTCHL